MTDPERPHVVPKAHWHAPPATLPAAGTAGEDA
jgi:hypothetical protein